MAIILIRSAMDIPPIAQAIRKTGDAANEPGPPIPLRSVQFDLQLAAGDVRLDLLDLLGDLGRKLAVDLDIDVPVGDGERDGPAPEFSLGAGVEHLPHDVLEEVDLGEEHGLGGDVLHVEVRRDPVDPLVFGYGLERADALLRGTAQEVRTGIDGRAGDLAGPPPGR